MWIGHVNWLLYLAKSLTSLVSGVSLQNVRKEREKGESVKYILQRWRGTSSSPRHPLLRCKWLMRKCNPVSTVSSCSSTSSAHQRSFISSQWTFLRVIFLFHPPTDDYCIMWDRINGGHRIWSLERAAKRTNGRPIISFDVFTRIFTEFCGGRGQSRLSTNAACSPVKAEFLWGTDVVLSRTVALRWQLHHAV